MQSGWEQTTPDDGYYGLTLGENQSITDAVFGAQFVGDPSVNDAPHFTSLPPTETTVGELFRYGAVATDPNDDPLSFDLLVKPEGMGIDSVTGIVMWRPGVESIGTDDVMIRVRDGRSGFELQSFQVTVRVNTSPVITSTPVAEAVIQLPWQYQTRAQDAERDALEFRLEQGPAGMTIDPVSGVVNWLPALGDVGNANVLIVVTDGHGSEATQTFGLQVVADAANVPPTITSAPGEIIKSGLIYRYRVQANDPNADPLTFQLDVAPAGMTIDGEGLIAWRPTVTELGLHPVRLRVEDGRGGIDTQDFTLQVNSLTSIQAPTIVSNPPFTATVDEPYRYDVQATAPNGSTLLFDLSTAPTGMSIDPWLGTIVWRPTAEQIGPRGVVVQVFDVLGSSTSQHFAVQVSSVNYSPSISSTPPTEAYVDDVYTYAVHTTDPDGDSLSYSMAGPPAMTIDPTTGLIQWTPTSTDVGVHSLVVVVSDGRLVGRQTFDLEVIAGTPNAAPNITSRPMFLATVDQPYEYQLVASDPEGDAISYDLPDFPFGMTVDANGLVAWTPVAGQEGPHVVTLVASDPDGAGPRSSSR